MKCMKKQVFTAKLWKSQIVSYITHRTLGLLRERAAGKNKWNSMHAAVQCIKQKCAQIAIYTKTPLLGDV